MNKEHKGVIRIGKYTLWSSLGDDKIIIETEAGEGGPFDIKKLEKVIDRFFKKQF